jgi:hypothetical protein
MPDEISGMGKPHENASLLCKKIIAVTDGRALIVIFKINVIIISVLNFYSSVVD